MGESSLKLPLVVLPGSEDLLILGQVTLRDVLDVDVMGMIKQTGLELPDDGRGESVGLGEWAGTEDVTVGDGKDLDNEPVGPILCGKQWVHVAMEAFGAE